jgi:ATP-dependent Clp protease ATP-binding subunit ClpC
MSEYMEKHNASRLVGAPPGYVGYEEGGQLTERIRRRPYAVVLLDEIEKAHGDVFNMLLQIMEEGRLTDSFGRKVDFANTVVIMTSNIGADILKQGSGLGFTASSGEADPERVQNDLMREVDRFFRPEFLNRLDKIVTFNRLERDDFKKIVHLELAKVTERLTARNIGLELTDSAVSYLIDKGYSEEFGARPLRRAIENCIEDPLSEELLAGHIGDGQVVVGDVQDGKLVFHPKEAEVPEPERVAAGADEDG